MLKIKLDRVPCHLRVELEHSLEEARLRGQDLLVTIQDGATWGG